MSEVNPEAGGTPPEATPTPTPAPPEPAPTLTPEMVDAWLKENNYTAYRSDDPALAKLNAPEPAPAPNMPNLPDYDPYDPNSVAKIVQEQTKDLDSKVSETVVSRVMAQLTPILSQFAQTQITTGVREEAKPFVAEILKEFSFTPLQLAQDPKVARLVNEAATARAIAAQKIPQSILFPADPPGGTGTGGPTIGDDAQQMLRMSEQFLGRQLTEDEKKVRIEEFELAKKREGLGV